MYSMPFAFANLGAAPPNPPQPLDLAEFDANFAFLFNPSVVNVLKASPPAMGDGTTNDLPAIQAAIDGGARVVYLPWTPAGYNLGTGKLKTGGSNCAIVGDPCGTMIISAAGRGNVSMIGNPTTDPADNAHRDSNLAFINLIVVGDKGSGDGQEAMGIDLRAVNRAWFVNVLTKNMDADGAYFGSGQTHQGVGCSAVRGEIRAESCGRQGVSVICGDSFDLSIYGYSHKFAALDGEVDNSSNFIRNSKFFVYAEGCNTGGGVSVGFDGDGGTGGGIIDEVQVTAIVAGALGDGVSWRACTNMTIRAKVSSPAGNGVVGGVGNIRASTVYIEAEVSSPGGSGLSARGAGDIVSTGRLRVTGAAQTAATIQNAAGGTLSGWELIGNTGAGAQIANCAALTLVAPQIKNNSSTGLWFSGTTTGVKVLGGSVTGNRFFGFLESAPATGNNLMGTDISGTSGGADITKASTSTTVIELPTVSGVATFTPGTIANGGTATATITVTGAVVGQNCFPSTQISAALGGCTISSAVTGANTVTATLLNQTGGSVTINSGNPVTAQAIVRRVF